MDTIEQLPPDWRRRVELLRKENARLRIRLRDAGTQAQTPMDKLPQKFVNDLRRTRAEAAKHRVLHREAKYELAQARLRIAKLTLDNADLRDGINVA